MAASVVFPWRGTVDQKYCFCPTLAAPLTLTLRPTSARNAFARKGSRRPMFFIARTHTSPQHARSEHPSHFNTACKDEFFREISSISQLKSEGDYGGAGGGGEGAGGTMHLVQKLFLRTPCLWGSWNGSWTVRGFDLPLYCRRT